MNIEQVMSITPGQLKKMNRDELGRTVSVLASAGNKRLKRMEQAGVETRASKEVLRGGKFSVKDKNVTQLVEEAKRATKFLRSSTGGLGAKGTRKQTEKKRRAERPKTMTVRELQKADISDLRKLNKEQLKRELDKFAGVANRRIKKMLDAGMSTKALTNVLDNDGLFTSEGKDTEAQLLNELKRAKQFLGNKGSTISGANRIHKNLEKRLGGPITQAQKDRLWSVYNMLREMKPALFRMMNSNEIQRLINSKMVGKKRLPSAEKLMTRVEKELQQMYEARQKTKQEIEAAGDFSEVSDNVSRKKNF